MDFIFAIIGVALLAVTFARLLGPFREVVGGGDHAQPCPRCSRTDAHSHWTVDWLRGWLSRPRPALTAQDWLPWTGALFPATLLMLFGAIAATRLLSGAEVTLAEAMLAAGGALAAVLAVLHVVRPTTT